MPLPQGRAGAVSHASSNQQAQGAELIHDDRTSALLHLLPAVLVHLMPAMSILVLLQQLTQNAAQVTLLQVTKLLQHWLKWS